MRGRFQTSASRREIEGGGREKSEKGGEFVFAALRDRGKYDGEKRVRGSRTLPRPTVLD